MNGLLLQAIVCLIFEYMEIFCMRLSNLTKLEWRLKQVAVLLLFGGQIGLGAAAEVLVEAEPRHHLVQDAGKYRIFDVEIPGGDTSLYHTHQADNFAIRVSASQVINETPEGKRSEYATAPGSVSYGTASKAAPYVHRVATVSGLFRAIMIELPPSEGALPPVPTLPAPYVLEKATPRGAMYQLQLSPGAQISLPHGGDALLVCLDEARLQAPDARHLVSEWSCRMGDYRLIQGMVPTRLVNPGSQNARLAVLVLP